MGSEMCIRDRWSAETGAPIVVFGGASSSGKSGPSELPAPPEGVALGKRKKPDPDPPAEAASSGTSGPSELRPPPEGVALEKPTKPDPKPKPAEAASSGTSFGHSLDIGYDCSLSSSSPTTADMFTVTRRSLRNSTPTLEGYDVQCRSVGLDISVVPGRDVPFPLRLRMPHTASRDELIAGGLYWMRSHMAGEWEVLPTGTCLLYTSPSPRDS